MSFSWVSRKCRLAELLGSEGDEDADGQTLDRLLHGQNVIGKTAKTTEIDHLRFQSKDLRILGTLESGQFASIEVVKCRLDGRVYVRKAVEKRLALRLRDQCSPQVERDLLLQALKQATPWSPHMLASYQTDVHLNFLMSYEEGGNLWNVLETSPLNSRLSESDLLWWTPQIVSSISWCHEQGYVHRDIKPHNFVLTKTKHVKLIDFGSAAPFNEVREVPDEYCRMPCGTCDYISPEILKVHEAALVALEMEDEERDHSDEHVYGVATDWWSLGAMLYELAFGVAPFFARDVRHTYMKIIDHRNSLRFQQGIISKAFEDFLRRLLTDAEFRLGAQDDHEVAGHPVFEIIDWTDLPNQSPPDSLHTPQFIYANDEGSEDDIVNESEDHDGGFGFSALLQSSVSGSAQVPSILNQSLKSGSNDSGSMTAPFIGFSWGPTLDAFPANYTPAKRKAQNTPGPAWRNTAQHLTPAFFPPNGTLSATPMPPVDQFTTPMRPSLNRYGAHTPLYQTLPRNAAGSTVKRRREVSDEEAMKLLVNCVGMSARKKVLESGRKPRVLNSSFFNNNSDRSYNTSKDGGDLGLRRRRSSFRLTRRPSVPDFTAALAGSTSSTNNDSNDNHSERKPPAALRASGGGSISSWDSDTDGYGSSSSGCLPPSPSPSPRPGSALSRRSATPTLTATATFTGRLPMNSSNSGSYSVSRTGKLSAGAAGPKNPRASSRSRSRSSSASTPQTAGSSSSRFIPSNAQTSTPRPVRSSSSEFSIDQDLTFSLDRSNIVTIPNASSSSASSLPLKSPSFHDETFLMLEEKHDALMDDLDEIEQRMKRVVESCS